MLKMQQPGSCQPERRRTTISVLILAKNEEARIATCLERVAWANEILVVDDMSVDRTADICRAHGAKVVQRKLDNFLNQANFGLAQTTGEWVLRLDADEWVTPELAEKIQQALRDPGEYAGFSFNLRNYFLGHCMRFGGWYHRSFHLFKRSADRFSDAVHWVPQVQGPIGHLEADAEHHPFQSLSQFMERQNRYTSMGLPDLRQDVPQLSARRLAALLAIRPLKLFRKSYWKKAGRREGMYGLVFGALFAWVEFLRWAKWWEASMNTAERWTGDAERRPPAARSERRRESGGARTAGVAQRQDPSSVPREKLSVVVLTKNEEARIARCLESVRWADEVVIVDGQSTDRTVEIAESFGAKIIRHAFDGSFATDRNLGLEAATGEWVLQIDADDVVTPEFRAAVERLFTEGSPHAAFKFRRRTVFLGRPMRYGGWHYAVPNLLRRGHAHYEGLVHERPVIDGTLGELDADIEHHPCEDLSMFLNRQNRYTSLQAQELLRAGAPLSESQIRRQIWKKPWKTFWKSYVKKQGFREGWHGLVFAEFFAGVELMKWAKYWECVRPEAASTPLLAEGGAAGRRERTREMVNTR